MAAPRWRRIVGPLLLFLLLAIAFTWPLAWGLGTTFVYPRGTAGMLPRADSLLTSWIVTWGAHALRTNPLAVFDANIFHPLRGTLAFSEHLLAGAALVLPIDAIASDPVRNNNLLVLATFVIGGAGTAWLVRELGGSMVAAIAAGVFAFFGPIRLAHIGHLHVLSLHWLPVALALLHRTWRTASTPSAVLLAVAIALQALSGVYLAYYSALALAVLVTALWLAGCPRAVGAGWRIVGAAVAAGAVVGPVMLPYVRARDTFVLARDPGEAFLFSARGVTYLGAFLDPLVHLRQRFLADGWPVAVVGVGLLSLAIVGLVIGASSRRGGRRVAIAYGAVAVAMALVSFGPSMQLRPSLEPGWPGIHLLLARVVPGYEALRVPYRAAGIVVLSLAVLAAFGVDAVLRRVGPSRRWVAMGGLVTLLVFESWHPRLSPSPVTGLVSRDASWERWIEAQPDREPVLVLPFGMPEGDAAAMVQRVRDWRPLVNGYSGFEPAGYYLRRMLAAFPDRASIDLLAKLGVRWVLVRGPAFRAGGLPSPCDAAPLPADLRLAQRADDGCVLEIAPAPASPAAHAGTRVRPFRMSTSTGESLALDATGDLAQPWSQPVERDKDGWLQVDLGEPLPFDRIELGLGSRFGLYPRRYRIEVSDDAQTWTVARDEPVGEAPLVGYRQDPTDLRVVIDVPPQRARFVRIVRPALRDGGSDVGVGLGWGGWGAERIAISSS